MKVNARHIMPAACATLVLSLAACGGNDDTDAESPQPDTPTPTATSEPPTATPDDNGGDPSPTPTPDEPRPTRQPAGDIATGPGHTIYEASGGESLDDVAAWFDGDTEDGGAFDASALAQLNGLDASATLESGDEIAVPAAPPDNTSTFAWNTLQQRLDQAGDDRPLAVLHPSRELIEGFLGRIALRSVSIDTGDEEDAPRGYVFRFSFTDRPAFRAGVPQEDANYTDPAFTLTAGSRANDILEMPGEEVGLFTRDGVSDGILTFEQTELASGPRSGTCSKRPPKATSSGRRSLVGDAPAPVFERDHGEHAVVVACVEA
ncbi:MAG: hypothetical protein U5Q44_06340 [Dehalococcoidia bacterium]|nr:hypothetical protein [Dehalococcoidia bacterium]